MSKKQQKQLRKQLEEQALDQQLAAKASAQVIDAGNSKLIYLQGLIIILFAFFLYGNTLLNQYAVDDTIVITKNTLTKQGFAGIPKIMTTDAFYGFFGEDYKFVAGGRYRPLSIVTFAIEYQLLGKKLNPTVSHFINIVLYAITCWMVLLVLLQLFKIPKLTPYLLTLPFVAALIFTAHPIHTEVVANIKGRDEIMGMLGSVLTLYWALRYVREQKMLYIGFLTLSFIMGLLSKENAITFLAVVPLSLYFFTNAKAKDYAITAAPLLIIAVIFVYMRSIFTPVDLLNSKTTEILNDPFINCSVADRFATIAFTFGEYIRLLLVPHPLTYDYYYNQVPIIGWDDFKAIIPFLINLAIVVYACVRLTKKDPVAYAILYYFITLSIVSNILFTVGIAMNERFVFMSSFGFAILLAMGIISLFNYVKDKQWGYAEVRNPIYTWVLLGVLLSLYSLKTVTRNMDWKNDFVLFKADVVNSPNSAKVADAYGGELVSAADTAATEERKQAYVKEAERQLNRALQIYPTYQNALVLLGNALYKDKDNKDTMKVIDLYMKTFQRNAYNYEGNFNLAIIYRDIRQPANGIPYIKRAIQSKPDKPEGRYILADMYEKVGGAQQNPQLRAAYADSAIAVYIELQKRQPENAADLNYKIGGAYGKIKGDMDNAIAYLSKAIELNPKPEIYYEDLGVAYGFKGDYPNAIKTSEAGLKTNPKYAPFYANIGITYRQMKNETMAKQYLRKANEADPKRFNFAL